MRAMNLIFNRGKDHNQQRVWNATELQSTVVPAVGVLPKDHKPPQANGDPVTRPVCFAKHTINGEMSELTSSNLDPAEP